MATVVNVPQDQRGAEAGNALAQAVDQVLQARRKNQVDTSNAQAMKSAVNSPDWSTALNSLINGVDPSTDPQALAGMSAIIGNIHRGTQPQTPDEINKIMASLRASMAKIQSSENIAESARELTRSEREADREARATNIDTTIAGARAGEVERSNIETAEEAVRPAMAAGVEADRMISTISNLRGLQDKVKSGAAAPAITKILSVFDQFGIDVSGLEQLTVGDQASATAFQSQSSQALLSLMGGKLGSGFSDADREFIGQIGPGLGKSAEGNLLIMDFMEAGAKKTLAITRELAKMQAKGAHPTAVHAKLEELREASSILNEDFKKRAEELSKQAPAAASPPGTPAAPNAAGMIPNTRFRVVPTSTATP